jgi:hypothetical protein
LREYIDRQYPGKCIKEEYPPLRVANAK